MNAMNSLELPNAERLFENLPYIGTDTIDKRQIGMIKKDGKFKIKATINADDFLEYSEDDWEQFGIRWLKHNLRQRVSEELFNKEIECLKIEYDALQPGATVHSAALGYSIRKRQTHNIEVDGEDLPQITKLIAKIVVCFLWFVLSPQQIATIPYFEMLVKHARFDDELKKYLINWCPFTQEVEYHKLHRIRLHVFDNTLIVDIILFGYPNWRTVLHSTSPIIMKDMEDNLLEEIQLILDFEKIENREKYIGLKYLGESRVRYFPIVK